MKSAIIQLLMSLSGIGLSFAGKPEQAITCIVGSFVIWALKED